MQRRPRRSTQPLDRMSRVGTATFVTPLVVSVGLMLSAMIGAERDGWEPLDRFYALVVGYVMALIATAFVVVPLRPLWRRWDFARAWVAAVVGTSVGSLMVAVFGYLSSQTPFLATEQIPVAGYIRFGATGGLAGIVFWFIARKEMRPNTSFERTRER